MDNSHNNLFLEDLRDQLELEQREWLEYQLYLVAQQRKYGKIRRGKRLNFQEFRIILRKDNGNSQNMGSYIE